MTCGPPSRIVTSAPQRANASAISQPDVARPHHHDALAGRLLGEGQEGGAVVERLHAVHVGQVDAGDVGPQRAGTGRDEEVVEGEVERPTVIVVTHLDPTGVEVDAGDLVEDPHVDALTVRRTPGGCGPRGAREVRRHR